MRHLLLLGLALSLNACTTITYVPTPVPELISKVTYTRTDNTGNNIWQLDNNTLKASYMKLSNSGRLIQQRVIKATPNDFNIVATGLENAAFRETKSRHFPSANKTTEKLTVETLSGTHMFTQDSKTRFPEKVDVVAKTIPQLFNR